MKYWLYKGRPQGVEYGSGVFFRETLEYTEFFLPVNLMYNFETDSDEYAVVYTRKIDDHKYMFWTSWAQWFDSWNAVYAEKDIAPSFERAVQESLPNLSRFLRGASDPNNSDVALSNIADFDDYSEVWITSAVVGNVVLSDYSELFEGRPRQALNQLLEGNLFILIETAGGPLAVPNFLDYAGSDLRRQQLNRTLRGLGGAARDYGIPVLKILSGIG